jgi:RNA polymerase subunit RPABC4/transcription elongation factor Spt4
MPPARAKQEVCMSEKLISCKACGKEIARSVKICPHCGKRNKKQWWTVALILFLVIITLSVLGNITGENKTVSDAVSKAPSSVPSNEKRQNAGIWVIGNGIDEFGDETGEKYIASKNVINGTFRNSATQNSKLDVQLLYTDKNGLAMQLFEYGKDFGIPAIAIGMEEIAVSIQDGNGERYSLPGSMSQSWLYFNDKETVKEILMMGGNIKFRITIDTIGVRSYYSFDITNADGFDTIYNQYKEK